MADREGSIYYRNLEYFDFDKACSFLAKEGLSLYDKPENGRIIALDEVGDEFEISYEQAKQKVYGEKFSIW